ncbi:MAG: DUF4079 domain-containing protein [Cyanophyceae cyanobacterium]
MTASDLAALIHPTLAVVFAFPLIGIVTHYAWQTRQRRLKVASKEKSKIPPVVGREHVQIGHWLTAAVVGVALLGLTYPISYHIITEQVWQSRPVQVIFIGLIWALTVASLVFLLRAQQKLWKGIFATLTGMGLIVLGCQDGVFRRTNEWWVSHYYFGIAAALLMLFSVAIVEDIYQDRQNRWRTAHIVLNCVALLLFLGQGFTGARDLLEIPLSWQKPYIFQCDFNNMTCPQPSSQRRQQPFWVERHGERQPAHVSAHLN